MSLKCKTRRAGASVMAACLAATLAGSACEVFAEVTLPPISVGAGLRASFDSMSPETGPKVNDFNFDNVWLFINGPVMEHVKFIFNTQYAGNPPKGVDSVQVMEAVASFEYSDYLNVWAGRFLPPSDRANMYGPYFANQWATYKDGVQGGYPTVAVGRDNGVMYWGQFSKLKVSTGVFDVPNTLGSKDVVWANRLQLDLWDPEVGYYIPGTYYGAKDILAIGLAAQTVHGNKAYTGDFLLEKKLPNDGALSVEAEYAKYDHFGGYAGDHSHGYYVLGSYIFPQVIGIGRIQPLVKYAHTKYEFDTNPTGDEQKTADFELNYLMRNAKARLSLYYLDVKFDHKTAGSDYKAWGLGLQVMM